MNTTTGLPAKGLTTAERGRPTTTNTVLRAFRCPKDLSEWADQMAAQGHNQRRYTFTHLVTLALHELKKSFAAEESAKPAKAKPKQPTLFVSKSSTPGMGKTVQKKLPLKPAKTRGAK